MLTNPSSTSRSDIVALGPQQSYDPYLPYANITHSKNVDPDRTSLPHLTIAARQRKSRFEGLANLYDAVSWIFGFKEKYSLALRAFTVSMAFSVPYSDLSTVIFFGGTLIGFCLARTMMMNPKNVRDLTVPGWWSFY
jgi:hypothetical protein